MTLRESLSKVDWEAFRNSQNEEWNRIDVLNMDESDWLDSEREIYGNSDCIIDENDEYSEV